MKLFALTETFIELSDSFRELVGIFNYDPTELAKERQKKYEQEGRYYKTLYRIEPIKINEII